MRVKVKHNIIQAYRSKQPSEVDRRMVEAEGIELPQPICDIAADIARTVEANNKRKAYLTPEVIADYVLRYAFALAQQGELVEAPPKPKKPSRAKGVNNG